MHSLAPKSPKKEIIPMIKKNKYVLLILTISILFLTACEKAVTDDRGIGGGGSIKPSTTTTIENPEVHTALSSADKVIDPKTARDNTPVCLETTAPGTASDGNDLAVLDYSNYKDGYVMVNYLGSCAKVKLLITGPDGIQNKYDIKNGYAAFPLTGGNGTYEFSVCENISGTKYSVAYATSLDFPDISEFGPYLHPNQYVYYKEDNMVITKGANLAAYCSTDLDVVTNVYDFITQNIVYDYDKANTVASGYISNVDEILQCGTGICLDYAAVMTSMLRSQRIPTRLEVGYVGAENPVYHAWISVYIEDVGWLNGIIQFNGKEWSLVDPTFGASTDPKTLKKYIGDGTNYEISHVY